jgi:hypothetical protein
LEQKKKAGLRTFLLCVVECTKIAIQTTVSFFKKNLLKLLALRALLYRREKKERKKQKQNQWSKSFRFFFLKKSQRFSVQMGSV